MSENEKLNIACALLRTAINENRKYQKDENEIKKAWSRMALQSTQKRKSTVKSVRW